MTNQPNVYFKDSVTGEEYIGVPALNLEIEILCVTIGIMSFPLMASLVWYTLN